MQTIPPSCTWCRSSCCSAWAWCPCNRHHHLALPPIIRLTSLGIARSRGAGGDRSAQRSARSSSTCRSRWRCAPSWPAQPDPDVGADAVIGALIGAGGLGLTVHRPGRLDAAAPRSAAGIVDRHCARPHHPGSGRPQPTRRPRTFSGSVRLLGLPPAAQAHLMQTPRRAPPARGRLQGGRSVNY